MKVLSRPPDDELDTPELQPVPVRGDRRRALAFVALSIGCVASAVGYVAHAQQRDGRRITAPEAEAAGAPSAGAIEARPHVVIRNLKIAPGSGQLGLASLDDPNGARAITGLQCQRVYMAAGNGLCLSDRGQDLFNPYQAVFFGPDFQPRAIRPLAGVPSRARVSADGRIGSSTVFVTGDSYAAGSFSTRTTIFDMTTGNVLADLEKFDVYKNGSKIHGPDFNFWGVTFAREDGRFYATLGTAGHTYLVQGDFRARRVDVLRDGVECPSLSPDNTQIAFKQRINSDRNLPVWRLAVLDLATLQDHGLAETRNVDDQAEWLDDSTVVYAVDTGSGPLSTWATPADGSGQPREFIADADSPSIARA
jgi:hypothetical protein